MKSDKWVKNPLRIKVHLTGFACAYEDLGGAQPRRSEPVAGRPQGSLYNQQKHAIADAIEWIRLNAQHKPRIFVATTPGFLSNAHESDYIRKLTANLRNGYNCNHYVWVRELTKRGFPHFHFVADMPEFDPVRLSLYWSGLHQASAKNSIRLGTRPDSRGNRKFWVSGPRMCWYMSKYIGKSLGEFEKKAKKRRPRTFGISEEARAASQPLIYDSYTVANWRGMHERVFHLTDEQIDFFADKPESMPPITANPYDFNWKWTGFNQTYVGFRTEKKQRKAA